MRRWFDIGWLLLWGGLSSAWCLSAARELSATFDEPFYLREALTSWRTGSYHGLMRAGTPPLSIDLQYLPIYLWERARGEPFDFVTDFHAILPYARAMNLVFWWLLLIYALRVGRTFGGPWAGRFAVLLIATEPSLLAHAALASTDISVAGLTLAFAFHYFHGRDAGRFRRWVLPGLLFGLALTAKLSALTALPLVMVAIEVPRWWRSRDLTPLSEAETRVSFLRRAWRISSAFRWDFIKVFTVASVFLWTYCGSDWKPQQSFVKLADGMADDHPWKREVTWISRNLRVFPNAGEAIAYQVKHNIRGHPTGLLGEYHRRAVWYYFPVALSIKLTLPVLVLLAGLLVLRPRAYATPIALAALLLLVFSLNTRVQIGVRIVFPLVVVLLVALASALASATESWRDSRRGGLVVALTAICVYPPMTVWPDGLRYANELWGGTENAHHLLTESNFDWGQGLVELDRWTDERGLPRTAVWYYGMDPAIQNQPGRLLQLHWEAFGIKQPADTMRIVRGKVVAVGYSMLHGNPHITETMPAVIEFFQAREPIGHTRTFFVYDFRE